MFEVAFRAAIAFYLLYQLLGNSVFFGLGCMLVAPPISFITASIQNKLRLKLMEIKDERIRLMNEVVSGIRVSTDMSQVL